MARALLEFTLHASADPWAYGRRKDHGESCSVSHAMTLDTSRNEATGSMA